MENFRTAIYKSSLFNFKVLVNCRPVLHTSSVRQRSRSCSNRSLRQSLAMTLHHPQDRRLPLVKTLSQRLDRNRNLDRADLVRFPSLDSRCSDGECRRQAHTLCRRRASLTLVTWARRNALRSKRWLRVRGKSKMKESNKSGQSIVGLKNKFCLLYVYGREYTPT